MAASFGPPPATLGHPTPWLLTGRPADPDVPIASRLRPAAWRPESPPAHAATQASRTRQVARRRTYGAPPTDQRPGPCAERHLPLSRHTPRALTTRAERKHPPKWQPEREWRSWSLRPGDSDDAAPAVPLRGFSQNVVEQCAPVADPPPWSTRVTRVTGGGWAADVPMPPPSLPAADADARATTAPVGASDRLRDAWELEEAATHFAGLAAAQQLPRSTLSLVDAFLGGPVAAGVLPPGLRDV